MPTIRNILNIQGSKAQAAALLDFVVNGKIKYTNFRH